MELTSNISTESRQDSVFQTLIFDITESEWDDIRLTQNVRFRFDGKVTKFPMSVLNQMTDVKNKYEELKEKVNEEEEKVIEEEEKENEFEEDQKLSEEKELSEVSSPYQLQWEGDLDRSPMVQPLPSNPTNIEANVTVRFEVMPDGTLGRVFPLRKMNPELEREIMKTLRSWRFSRLPSGVPHDPQWGTITFRFIQD